jgi:DNA (cytosine-5)-methyltransferase 1
MTRLAKGGTVAAVTPPAPFTFYEFFAGGGMARTGLGAGWRCLFANDFDAAKAEAYRANFGGEDLVQGDVWNLDAGALPGRADLAWASSPCQDLSLAGARRGLEGQRSSAFWGFWRLIEQLEAEGRAPRAIGVENVTGLLSSHAGADFTALCAALASLGYRFGALEIDAAMFVPQSRPRLFVLAVKQGGPQAGGPAGFHTPAVMKAFERLPEALKQSWIWWRIPPPPRTNTALADVLEPDDDVRWLPEAEALRLLSLMAPLHRARIEGFRLTEGRHVGTAFRRTRIEAGQRVQRAEVRFDGIAGCLRTPTGGSSRQFLVLVEEGRVRARLLTAREAARLMGLPDDYRLPARATAALHLAGDGVAAPIVRHLAAHLLEPLLSGGARAAA